MLVACFLKNLILVLIPKCLHLTIILMKSSYLDTKGVNHQKGSSPKTACLCQKREHRATTCAYMSTV